MLVQVTPHINAGGLVTLEVQAEVSTPGATSRVCEAPPINTRSVQTYHRGPDRRDDGHGRADPGWRRRHSSGLPFLSRIPYFGGLFGNQVINKNRTELVLFVTPRVMENEYDTRGVVDDLRRRMERLESVFPPARPGGPPAVPPAPSPFVAPR